MVLFSPIMVGGGCLAKMGGIIGAPWGLDHAPPIQPANVATMTGGGYRGGI